MNEAELKENGMWVEPPTLDDLAKTVETQEVSEEPEHLPNQIQSTEDDTVDPSDEYLSGMTPEQLKTFNAMPEKAQETHRRLNLNVIASPEARAKTDNIRPEPGKNIQNTRGSSQLSWQSLYGGEQVDAPRPTAYPVLDFAADMADTVGFEETAIQRGRDKRDAREGAWFDEAMKIYDDIPGHYRTVGIGPLQNGIKIHMRQVRDPETGKGMIGEDGRPVMEAIEVPKPNTPAGARLVKNVFNNIYGNVRGLIEEGKLSGMSDAVLNTPSIDSSPGERIIDEIITFGLPAVGATKGVSAGFKALGIGQGAQAGHKAWLARLAKYSAIAAATAGTDTLMSEAGTDGFFISDKLVESTFKEVGYEISPESAKDTALFLDALVWTGGADTLLKVLKPVFGFFGTKGKALRRLASDPYTVKQAENATVLQVMLALDPTIGTASPRMAREKMKAMARMFNDNAILDLSIGDVTGQVQRDGATTVLAGARAYVIETMKSPEGLEYGSDAFNQWVDSEAARMGLSMMSFSRAMTAAPEVLAQKSGMADGVYDLIQRAGRHEIPEGITDYEAYFRQQMDTLVAPMQSKREGRRQEIGTYENDIGVLEDEMSTLLTDNSTNMELQQGFRPELPSTLVPDSRAAANTISNAGMDSFNADLDNIWQSYGAIKGVAPIDASGIQYWLKEITKNNNRLDASGEQGKALVADIKKGFKQRPLRDGVEGINISGQGVTFETAEEALYHISNDVKYEDLVKLARDLEVKISSEQNPELKKSLIGLKNHLLSADPPKFSEQNPREILVPAGQLWNQLQASGGATTRDQLEAAKNAYATFKSKWESTPTMRIIAGDMADVRKGRNYPHVDGQPSEHGVSALESTFVETLPSMAQDPTLNRIEALKFALRDIPREDWKTVTAVLENTVKRDVAAALASGDPKQLSAAMAHINNNAALLESIGSNLEAEVKSMIKEVEGGVERVGNLSRVAQDNLAGAKEQLKQTNEDILIKFLDTGDSDNLVGNPVSVLQGILFGDQAGDQMRKLYQRVDRLPQAQAELVRGALKERVSDILTDSLRGATAGALRDGMPLGATKGGWLKSITDHKSNDVLGAMEQVYGVGSDEYKGFAASLNALIQSEAVTNYRMAKFGETAANVKLNQDMEESVGTGILFLFGYMNPTAAAVRRLTSTQVAQSQDLAKLVGRDVLLAAVSNPLEFGQMITRMRKAETPSAKRLIARTFGETVSHGVGYDIRTSTPEERGYTGSRSNNIVETVAPHLP